MGGDDIKHAFIYSIHLHLNLLHLSDGKEPTVHFMFPYDQWFQLEYKQLYTAPLTQFLSSCNSSKAGDKSGLGKFSNDITIARPIA